MQSLPSAPFQTAMTRSIDLSLGERHIAVLYILLSQERQDIAQGQGHPALTHASRGGWAADIDQLSEFFQDLVRTPMPLETA